MLIVNLFSLKNTNGMYYYALDYVKRGRGSVDRILVRSNLAADVRREFPELTVIECGLGTFIMNVMSAWVQGAFFYAPTPHPLPLISRQLIVVHDPYPFFGRLGRLKKFLLRASLGSSRCLVGYINRSEAKEFVMGIGVAESRQVFAPNYFPMMVNGFRKGRDEFLPRLKIGLVGTDSPKKNYEFLFDDVITTGHPELFEFHIYGHRSAYLAGLTSRFGAIHHRLVESDRSDLAGFLEGVDVVVAVALNEGFGRPIAAALTAGVPCLLLDTRVFREFFDGAAEFETTIGGIVARLVRLQNGEGLKAVRFGVPASVTEAQNEIECLLDGASRKRR